MLEFKVRTDLNDERLTQFEGRVGTSPLKEAGLMIPVTFETGETLVLFPWEVIEIGKKNG